MAVDLDARLDVLFTHCEPMIAHRVCYLFYSNNITTVRDLLNCTQDDLLGIPRVGLKTLQMIVDSLQRHGLVLKQGQTK